MSNRVDDMAKDRIPFNKAILIGNELAYIQDALEEGHISDDGPFTKKCHTLLETALNVPKVLLTISCTHAPTFLLKIQPGDEVFIPSFTFVTSINAFVLRAAKPIFADIRSDTLTLDERNWKV